MKMPCFLCKIFPSVKPSPQDAGLVAADPEFDEDVVPYHIYHYRGQQPDPGAAAYAYDTVMLMPFYPINRFGNVKTPIRPFDGPQLWVQAAATIYELPQPNGQLFSQGLIDPNAAVDQPADLD